MVILKDLMVHLYQNNLNFKKYDYVRIKTEEGSEYNFRKKYIKISKYVIK